MTYTRSGVWGDKQGAVRQPPVVPCAAHVEQPGVQPIPNSPSFRLFSIHFQSIGFQSIGFQSTEAAQRRAPCLHAPDTAGAALPAPSNILQSQGDSESGDRDR